MNLQINYPSIQAWFIKNWSVIALVIVSLLLFRTCQGSKEAQLANNLLKKDIKISKIKAQKYVEQINVLYDSLTVLERMKQREKLIIKTVIKEVEVKKAEIESLKIRGIAAYYQNRYKLPVIITQYGVALNDTIAKLNIVDVIERDGFKTELDLTKNVLLIEEKKGVVKDSIITNKSLIIVEKDVIIDSHLGIEKNLNKSIKIEKSKKTFWQAAFGAAIIGAGYLLAK